MQSGSQSPTAPVRAEDHVGLVVRIARRYVGRGPFGTGDLVGYGYLGLVRGVAKANAGEYDPARSKLSTYLAAWIRESIKGAVADLTPLVRVPRYHLDAGHGDETSRARYARHVAAALATAGGGGEAAAAPARDEPPDARLLDEEERAARAAWLHAALSRLDGRSRAVLRLRYGLDDGVERTYLEVGAVVGVSREWARKVERKALARLRELAGVA